MLDPKLIRSHPDLVRQAIADKREKADLDLWLALDEKRRPLLSRVEDLRARRNAVSEEIGRQARDKGADPAKLGALKQEMTSQKTE